jgi:3-methyladenine DNA glycosylase AlkD
MFVLLPDSISREKEILMHKKSTPENNPTSLAELGRKPMPDDIRRRLRAVATEEYRISAQRYFKEEIKIIGVRSADAKLISREAIKWCRKNGGLKAALELAIPLWKSPTWEEHLAACNLIYAFPKEYDDSTWNLCDEWIDDLGDWAACDFLSADIISAHLDDYPNRRKQLLIWTKSPNRWRRRAAAVALVKQARKGKYLDDVWKVASPLMPDKDDMVKKGVGWLLREAARTAPAEVVAFCKKHEHHAARFILRTASETMSDEWKKKLLGK